jgi:hypothetical protein
MHEIGLEREMRRIVIKRRYIQIARCYVNIFQISDLEFRFSLMKLICYYDDHRCGLVVRVTGHRSRDPGFDSPALPVFLKSNWSGTRSTQPREDVENLRLTIVGDPSR